MTPNIMGIKELQLNLKRVADAAEKGASFTIVRGSKPVFRIEPVTKPTRTGTFEDLLNDISFKGNPDLSQRVDEIVYGGNTR